MEPQFWHDRWKTDQIGFHEAEANPALVAHFDRLALQPGARVFVPLCGKTRDIAWLLERGMRVVGAELSEIAVAQLFREMGVKPEILRHGAMRLYRGPDVEVFAGDIFDLGARDLGRVEAVYDRAALVALPPKMRAAYARHLTKISAGAPQLLITFAYDQSARSGPPFSVPAAEVRGHYGETYALEALEEGPMAGGLKGLAAERTVWLMR